MTKIGKHEKERMAKNIKSRAVLLKNLVLLLKKTTGIDMREDIIDFFTDRFEDGRQ